MLKVKLVIVSSIHLFEPVIINRIIPFINLFLAEGFEVILVCPKGKGNNSLLPEGTVLKEVEVSFKKPKGFIQRALREMSDVRLLLKEAKHLKADVYLLTIPSMFLAFLTPVYLRTEKVFLDVRDLTWEYLSEASFVQRQSKRVFRAIFKVSLKYIQGVSVTNPTELNYVLKLRNKKRKPVLVTNGISQEQFDKLAEVNTAVNDQVTVVYVGNIGLAQHLDTLVEAATLLPNVSFKIVGAGIDYERIKDLVVCLELSNIELTGRVPWDEVKNYYDCADILYAQLTPDYAGAMPSKLYEYLATGKYIVYGGQAQAAEKLAEFSHNRVIPPCSTAALVDAVKRVQESSGWKGLCLSNREQITRYYIREAAAKILVSEVKLIL